LKVNNLLAQLNFAHSNGSNCPNLNPRFTSSSVFFFEFSFLANRLEQCSSHDAQGQPRANWALSESLFRVDVDPAASIANPNNTISHDLSNDLDTHHRKALLSKHTYDLQQPNPASLDVQLQAFTMATIMDTMIATVLNLVQAAGPQGESHDASWTHFPPLSRLLLPAVACMAVGQLAFTRWLECKGALLAQWPWRTPFFFTSFFETRPRRFRGESRGDLQGEDLLLPGQGDWRRRDARCNGRC
jgi:hypothetical protein